MTPLRLAAVVLSAALAGACVATYGWTADAVVAAAGCLVLAAVTVTDLERRIVPNRVVLPALAAALIVQTLREPGVEWIVSALGAGGFFLLAAILHPAGLGMGDVKLAAFLGAWLGRDVVVALFVGSLLAFVPAVVLLALKGSAARKIGLPFAPFLAAGGVVALFVGGDIVDWWLD